MRHSSEPTISTKLVETWDTVTADPPLLETDVRRESISEVDEFQTKSSHWLGFTLRFEGVLDPPAVKKGLERTLFHIPALGARVTVDEDSKLRQLEVLPDRGVVLEYYKGETSQKDIHLPDDSDSRELWKQAGLEAPGAGYSGEATEKEPLLRARLIVFEAQKISYLCIGINHGLCDGSGMCDILQVWSHFSANDDNNKPLPEHIAQRRLMGNRVSQPHKPAKSVSELYERLPEEVGCPYDPYSFWTFLFKLLPKAIWCMGRQQVFELRVHANKIAALKESITQQLPKGEWVSKFEVLCASLLLAKQVTSPTIGTYPSQHKLHVACNLRERSKRFGKDYFGNAAFDFRETMTLPGSEQDKWNVESVTAMSQEVHRAMRTGLANAETNACQAKDWFEAARHLGLENKYDIWLPVVFDVLQGTGTFVNSWDNRWLDCGMQGVPATSMITWIGTVQNFVVDVPRHAPSGDSTIYFALPPAHAKRFQAFCRDRKTDLPFEVVQ